MKHTSYLALLCAFAAAGLCRATRGQAPLFQSSATPSTTEYKHADACTFTVSQIQRCGDSASPPANYLQINEILAADGSVAVDVRAKRPMQAFHSYKLLDPTGTWDVAHLNKGDMLSISQKEDSSLEFRYGEVRWTDMDDGIDGRDGKGWCVGEWHQSSKLWNCGEGIKRQKVSRLLARR